MTERTWVEDMFDAPDWQAVQLAWETAEDADAQTALVERALRLAPGSRVLDAPCGTGRIATRLAARGHRVVGVDRTEAFLEAARARGDGARYERGDMRDLPYEGGFDAVVCLWGSFGYFDRDGDLAQARSAARALDPGGRYLIDVPTAETVLPRFQDRISFEVGGVEVRQDNAFDEASRRVETTWTFTRPGGTSTRHTSMRLYAVPELTDLLTEAGFAAFEVRDDELGPFGPDSLRLWLVATI